MPDIHAKLCSPSGADGWFACAGRIVMESSFPDKGSEYSNDGTARHAVCASALNNDLSVDAHVGYYVRLSDETVFLPNVGDNLAGCVQYVEDWVEEDRDYVDTIKKLAGPDDLFVERVVNFERFTEVKGDSFGTADAIIFKPLPDGTYELIVADRKTGYHEVPVENNKQLRLYALGAYDEFGMVYEISRVRLIIHQRGAREWDCSVEELLTFAQEARSRAITVQNAVAMHGKVDQAEWEATFLNPQPSESACKYCKAMAVCPSMQRAVQETVGGTFDVLATGIAIDVQPMRDDNLAKAMASAGLLEDFVKAVRAEVERRLLAGTEVPGFKLVLGKQGNRKWTSEEAAIEMLRKTFRLPVEKAFELTVISPTTAEKLHKAGEIGKRQWPKLQPLIGRADPKPSVAPESDKRERYVPPNVADDFEPVAETASDLC